MLEEIEKRAASISQQLQQTNAQILQMTDNLNTTKNQAQQLQGHLNEVLYTKEMLEKAKAEQEKKDNEQKPDESANAEKNDAPSPENTEIVPPQDC